MKTASLFLVSILFLTSSHGASKVVVVDEKQGVEKKKVAKFSHEERVTNAIARIFFPIPSYFPSTDDAERILSFEEYGLFLNGKIKKIGTNLVLAKMGQDFDHSVVTPSNKLFVYLYKFHQGLCAEGSTPRQDFLERLLDLYEGGKGTPVSKAAGDLLFRTFPIIERGDLDDASPKEKELFEKFKQSKYPQMGNLYAQKVLSVQMESSKEKFLQLQALAEQGYDVTDELIKVGRFLFQEKDDRMVNFTLDRLETHQAAMQFLIDVFFNLKEYPITIDHIEALKKVIPKFDEKAPISQNIQDLLDAFPKHALYLTKYLITAKQQEELTKTLENAEKKIMGGLAVKYAPGDYRLGLKVIYDLPKTIKEESPLVFSRQLLKLFQVTNELQAKVMEMRKKGAKDDDKEYIALRTQAQAYRNVVSSFLQQQSSTAEKILEELSQGLEGEEQKCFEAIKLCLNISATSEEFDSAYRDVFEKSKEQQEIYGKMRDKIEPFLPFLLMNESFIQLFNYARVDDMFLSLDENQPLNIMMQMVMMSQLPKSLQNPLVPTKKISSGLLMILESLGIEKKQQFAQQFLFKEAQFEKERTILKLPELFTMEQMERDKQHKELTQVVHNLEGVLDANQYPKENEPKLREMHKSFIESLQMLYQEYIDPKAKEKWIQSTTENMEGLLKILKFTLDCLYLQNEFGVELCSQ